MSYDIVLTAEAERDILKLRKTVNKQLLMKLNSILNELRENPYEGTGKTEQLKYYSEPAFSKRINKQHRLVYRIYKSEIIVLVLTCYGHSK